MKQLLQRTDTDPESVDALIVATTTADYTFPNTASLIIGRYGLKNAYGFDLWAACSGFLFAMDQASSMIESGRYKKVIVCCAEKMSSIVD